MLEIPDLTAEVEKTVSQQALQQLGKEMRVKGIAVPPPCADPFKPALLLLPFHNQPLGGDYELDPLCPTCPLSSRATATISCFLYLIRLIEGLLNPVSSYEWLLV